MKTLLSALLGFSLISGIAFANSAKKDKKNKKKPVVEAPATNPTPDATKPATTQH